MMTGGPYVFDCIFLYWTLDRWHNFRTLCDYSKRIAVGKSTRVQDRNPSSDLL